MFRLQRETGHRTPINWFTVHRMFATAFLVAQKTVDSEELINNTAYAPCCGLAPYGLFILNLFEFTLYLFEVGCHRVKHVGEALSHSNRL